MTGLFGDIDEPHNEGKSHFSHADRFGATSFVRLKWRRGRDLLLIEAADVGNGCIGTFPGLPRLTSESSLWFPVAASSRRKTGPVYSVGVRSKGSLLRARSSLPVQFVPGALTVVGSRRAIVLCELDGSDASQQRQRLRFLKKGEISRETLETMLAVSRNPRSVRAKDVHSDEDAGRTNEPFRRMPPAARTILNQIRSAPLGESHIAPFERRGAGALMETLVERELVIVLSSGQIVDADRLEHLRRDAGRHGLPRSPREAAERWRTSVGTARALLAVMRSHASESDRPHRFGADDQLDSE